MVRRLLERVRSFRLENPVLTKELRVRMRGGKAFWVMGVYFTVLALFLMLAYANWSVRVRSYGLSPGGGFTVGRDFFLFVFMAQAALVSLITPALSAGAITIEREQRTLEMLTATTLTPWQIVTGKLLSALAFVVILLIISVPVASLCLLFGGVSPEEIYGSYVLLALCGLVFASVGLLWSANCRRTINATLSAFVTLGLFLLVTTPIVVGVMQMRNYAPYSPGMGPRPGPLGGMTGMANPLLLLNPFGAVDQAPLTASVFSLTLPSWAWGIFLLPLVAGTFACAARDRLEHYRRESALAFRLLLLGMTALFILIGIGGSITWTRAIGLPIGSYYFGAYIAAMAIGSLLAVICLLLPPLCTSEERAPADRSPFGWLLAGLHPRTLFSRRLQGGPAFTLVWLGAGLAATAAILGPHALSAPSASSYYVPGPRVVAMGPAVLEAALVALAVVAGLSCLSVLLTTACRSRGTALKWTYFIMAVAWIVPAISAGFWTTPVGGSATHELTMEMLYFSPFIALLQIVNPNGFRGLPLWFGGQNVWLVTTLIYLGLAALCLVLTSVAAKRRAKQAAIELRRT